LLLQVTHLFRETPGKNASVIYRPEIAHFDQQALSCHSFFDIVELPYKEAFFGKKGIVFFQRKQKPCKDFLAQTYLKRKSLSYVNVFLRF
jgi:hypothetical protein